MDTLIGARQSQLAYLQTVPSANTQVAIDRWLLPLIPEDADPGAVPLGQPIDVPAVDFPDD